MFVFISGMPLLWENITLNSEQRIDSLSDMIIGFTQQFLASLRISRLRLIHKYNEISLTIRSQESQVGEVHHVLNIHHIHQIEVS